HTPGIELVMEANESYWRKVPSVKRLVYKVVPESTTRVAMLKRGEVDIAYLLEVPQAQELKRDPNVKLAFSGGIAVFFLDFLDQLPPDVPLAEAIIGNLQAVGIKLKMRPMERAAYFAALQSRKAKGLCVCSSALYGNAASRMSEIFPSEGAYAYGGYPDVDALYKQQARETDRKKREAMLHQIQQLMNERTRIAPIFEDIWPSGIG